MEIKKYTVGEDEFEFVCETYENSRAWGHRVTLFMNGVEITEHKIRYYNRTWENFRYQSCMDGAISVEMDNIIARHLERYKRQNDIKRFKAGEKQSAIEEIKKSERYVTFKKLYDYVSSTNGDREGIIK